MIEKIAFSYNNLLNHKLGNSTSMVAIIACLIVLVGVFVPQKNMTAYGAANVIGVSSSYENTNTVIIDGVKYQIIFKKAK